MDLSDDQEEVLNAEQWKNELDAVIEDIKIGLLHTEPSSKIKNTNSKIYFNFTTLEEDKYCVELSGSGFRVVGRKYDAINEDTDEIYYETPYALLNQLSTKFTEIFGTTLASKLASLQQS